MSLFLGKIHYWLYNKIIWAEKTETEIVKWAAGYGLAAEKWMQQFIEEYGAPTGNLALEDIIDTSNIHGWLQERIRGVELRQAALITAILAEDNKYKAGLVEIYKKQAEAAAQEYNAHPDTPEGIYNAVNDFILEGMPCDRASEMISNNQNEITWTTSTSLHEPYWLEVGGDVKNFYELREAWLASFVEALNPEFSYDKTTAGEYAITRQ